MSRLTVASCSENTLFAFEIEAGSTQFQAGDDARTALETLVDGDQWMIYRNIFTNVLHWDFVSVFSTGVKAP